jgi:AcrR family transcriptional regulator
MGEVSHSPASPVQKSGSSPADASQESILRATLALLEQHGYPNVTTDLIAAKAEVSKATLYRHWRTKQQLVVDAMRLHMNALEVPDLNSFQEEVRWVLELRLDLYRQPKILRLVGGLVGAATSDPQLQPIFTEWVEQLSRSIRQVVQRGIARGDVRPDVDLYAVETLIAGVIARTVVLQQSFSPATTYEIIELIDVAVRPA